MPVCGDPENLYIGHETQAVTDIHMTIRQAHDNRFDFIVIPIAKKPAKGVDNLVQSVASGTEFELDVTTGSDLALDSKTWSSAVCGAISDWIQPDDYSQSEDFRKLCVEVFSRELQWASHVGLYATICPSPAPNCANYARLLNQFLLAQLTTQLWVRIPLLLNSEGGHQPATSRISPPPANGSSSVPSSRPESPSTADAVEGEGVPKQSVEVDGWLVWNKLRNLCDFNKSIGIALEFTADLPDTQAALERWIAEPVKAVMLSPEIFLTNKNGYPVLSKRHKSFLQELFKHKIQVIIRYNPDDERYGQPVSTYLNYVARLFQQMPPPSQADRFEHTYLDYLQAPLQPLQDNLESQTYETFEKDPVKYVQYEEAVYRCLKDRFADGKKKPVVMVVGAGRGPLVQASLNALKRANLSNWSVYAVEKNQNAVITLRSRVQSDPHEGWRRVVVLNKDMRIVTPPEKADIMVSELLGSFGDNELSPECLDGAQRFLAPGGVSIPEYYYSAITPISTTKLWNDVKSYSDLEHFETAFVVRIHSAYYVAEGAPKKCFEFRHPNPQVHEHSTNEHNQREIQHTFTARSDALIHGFAGYFHCDLYKDVHISILPETFSTGMFSWFPLYFPLRQPVQVKKGETIRVHLWRRDDSHKVWYEWALTEPAATAIHNPGGRSYYIGK